MRIKSAFIRNVMALVTGTSLAQVVPLALSPVLTRLYTPSDFGVFALYVSLLSVLGVVASARYEQAIVQPDSDEDAIALLQLAVFVASMFSLLLFLIVLLFNEYICELLGTKEISIWLYLLPVSVFVMGVYQAISSWLIRKKKFKIIAMASVSQSCSSGGAQVAGGVVAMQGGLVLGNLVGAFVSLVVVCVSPIVRLSGFEKLRSERIKHNAVLYGEFPKWSLPGAVANNAGQQMPVFMMSRFFDTSALGLFGMAQRVVSIPIALVSGALSQVVYQKVVEMKQVGDNRIAAFILKIFFILVMLISPFVFLMFLWGGDIFSIVFGELWRGAGEVSGILVFAAAIKFAVSPLSVVLLLKENVLLGAVWQVVYLCTISATLFFLPKESLVEFVVGYAIHEVILYSLFMLCVLKGVKVIGPSSGDRLIS